MYRLSIDYSENEISVLTKCAGGSYEILKSIEGESYVLNEYGDYYYNECFCITKVEFLAKQRYQKVIPYKIVKFYQYFLMNLEGENTWYRGRKDFNGNWEYDCYFDCLEEAFDCL